VSESERLNTIETRLDRLEKASRAHAEVLDRTMKTSQYLRDEYNRKSMWDMLSPEIKAKMRAQSGRVDPEADPFGIG
jgi:hypothetical protein